MNATRLASIAACPDCHSALRDWSCPACGRAFPLEGPSRNLMPREMTPAPPAFEATTYHPFVEGGFLPKPGEGLILEIGSGNRLHKREDVVLMDVGPGEHVDALGDAHRLPFQDASFDFVFSLSVLEHLEQPFQAAAEMHRVLKPGGRVFCDTNFCFPYHSYPNHYFNFSIHGLRSVFRDFETLDVGIPPYGTPGFAITSIIGRFSDLLTEDPSKRGVPTVGLDDSPEGLDAFREALAGTLQVHGESGTLAQVSQIIAQYGLTPERVLEHLERTAPPHFADVIRRGLEGSPAESIPPTLKREAALACAMVLHLPWKLWDEQLTAEDAHGIAASTYYHGRKPA